MSPSGNVPGEELHWPCKSASPDSVTKRGGSMAVLGLPVERPWLEPGGPFVFFLA